MTTALMPAACAALCTSLVMADAVIAAAVASGVTRRPIVSNLGTMSRSNPICFVAAMLPRIVAPVTLPPGRLRLATMPDSTGSPPVVNTMGIVAVAALADSAELSPRSEEHTSELHHLGISYAVFCLKKKKQKTC